MLYLKGQVISGFLPNTFLIFDTQELKLMNFRSTISRLLLNQWFPTLFYLLISFQKEKKKKTNSDQDHCSFFRCRSFQVSLKKKSQWQYLGFHFGKFWVRRLNNTLHGIENVWDHKGFKCPGRWNFVPFTFFFSRRREYNHVSVIYGGSFGFLSYFVYRIDLKCHTYLSWLFLLS